MKNRMFSVNPNNVLVVDFHEFSNAVRASHSKAIDKFLEAKSAGYELNLNQEMGNDGSPLEYLLEKHDFKNARKLIAAGASTDVEYKTWVSDDHDCYPYGYYENKSRSLLEKFVKDKEVLVFLVHEMIDKPKQEEHQGYDLRKRA